MLLVSYNVCLRQEEVVIAFYLIQANLLLTIDDVVKVTINLIKAFRQRSLADTIFAQIIPQHRRSVFDRFYLLIASQTNVILNVVPLAVALVPSLHDHLAVRAKFVRTRRQIAICCPAVICARRTTAIRRYEVVVFADLSQAALRTQLTIFDVVQAIFHLEQTSIDHFAVYVEVILRTGKITVCLPCVILYVPGNITIIQEEVVITLYLMQANLLNTFNKVVQGTVNRIKPCTQCLNVDTILIKVAPSLVHMHFRLRANLLITF